MAGGFLVGYLHASLVAAATFSSPQVQGQVWSIREESLISISSFMVMDEGLGLRHGPRSFIRVVAFNLRRDFLDRYSISDQAVAQLDSLRTTMYIQSAQV